ncbi:A disintegrin and metalloproteinase with thrombospondin motifs 6-like isoform X2 [Apostichopus japonicus]|uniref:A disintegrin and metalloproteinase with thrombospondin motifs 6-like isoform X2 n=1 Tax=Stichopus japonicus TaxID=307972 RepID=UPI003AB8D730
MLSLKQLATIFGVIIGGFFSQGRHIPENDVLSVEELQEYSRDGSAIQEFDIISPQFISNDVFKRSTEHLESNDQPIHEVQYEAFDTIFNVQLEKNDWLVRKGLQVETLKADGTVERKPLRTEDCHYFGSLKDHDNSAAAISLCNGRMHGMLSHNETDYIIQPLRDNHASKMRTRRDVESPHIIYKKSVSRPAEESEDPTEGRHQPFCSYEAPVGYDPGDPGSILRRPGPKSISQSQPLPHVGQKYLELFVVADKNMVDFHGNNTEDYVFSLMNVVSRRYADPSLDITLRLHIVKLLLLDTDSPTLQGSTFDVTGASSTLDDFCEWQADINPLHDFHPEHWDNAILLTRKNIYTSIGNGRDHSLLGKAYLSSTCRRGLQCSFNQDDGLGSSLVIAHETGHTLGLNHDDDYGCMSGLNIMSSWRPAGRDSFTWSECSRQNIRTFLGGPIATCLNDVPSNSPLPVAELVGASYDLNEQCELALGAGAQTCQSNFVNCGYLRCRNATGCFSLGVGVMDGTFCEKGKWCLSGSCVEKQSLPNSVDGGWSDWGDEYGECSRTCGGGVRMRRRHCTNPRPRFGGRNCVGPAEQYEACNLEPCGGNQDDFRDEQCSQTNSIPFNGQNYTWKAFISGQDGDDLCTKKCLSNSNFWATRPPYQYTDGTRCWHGDNSDKNTLKLCVSGKCEQFGCDGIQGSGQVFDACRQCNGNGASCEQITGSFDGGRYRKHTAFLDLPVGATSIEIINVNLAYTHMAMSSGGDSVFQGYLFTPPSSGRYGTGSNIIKYTTDFRNFRERISIQGPLTTSLTAKVYLLYDPHAIYGVNVKPKITYRYFVPRDQSVFEWLAGQYGECSVTCGEGVQTRSLRCARIENGRPVEVSDSMCDQQIRPPSDMPCDGGVCPAPAQWVKGSWSECDAECGEGEQTRQVECQRGDVLAPGECSGERPRPSRRCNNGDCRPEPSWSVGEWSECSVTCGDGHQRRPVDCRRGTVLAPRACRVSGKPTVIQSCVMDTCPEWTVGEWSECDAPCGIGAKNRTVECTKDGVLSEGACEGLPAPSNTQECDAGDCLLEAEWVFGEWSECSADCGFGTKYRSVTCRRDSVAVQRSECSSDIKPKTKATCHRPPCQVPTRWTTGPWSPCSVTCGEGIQSRDITCERDDNEVTNKNCVRDLKPSKQRTCSRDPCPPPSEWVVSDWTECSTTCGEGVRERSVECRSGHEVILDSNCDVNNQPETRSICFVVECPPLPTWTASSWSECTVTCGGGYQTRNVRCQRGTRSINDIECQDYDLPETRQECNNLACPTETPAIWVTGEWNECDASCGLGVQTRSVTCQQNGQRVPGACASQDKPSVQRACENEPCVLDAEVNAERGACMQLLQDPAGSYTQSHPTGDSGCTTTLVAPFGKSFILTINSVIDCSRGEYLKIKEGTKERSVCGEKSDYVLTFTDNVISIVMNTVDEDSGYALSYERKDGRASNRCDRLYVGNSGTIKSPGYPRRYPSNADCRYRIVTEPGRQISLSFSRFSMQGHYPTCRYDKLEISDIFGKTQHKYCGTRNQLSIVSTGNDVLLRLRTDSRTNFSGFRAIYTVR